MRIILKTLTINIKNIKKLLFQTFDCQKIWNMHIWSILVHLCEFLLVPSIFRRNTWHWAECEKQLCNICSIAAKNHGMRPRSQNDKQKKLEAECLSVWFVYFHTSTRKNHQENSHNLLFTSENAEVQQRATDCSNVLKATKWCSEIHKQSELGEIASMLLLSA